MTAVVVPAAPVAASRLSAARTAAGFAGPAFLVSVGYVDPGNWGTDLAAGSRYGYRLLWVLLVANAMAMVLQHLSARLGIATGRDLAALLGERLRPWPRRAYATMALTAMGVTETAEFLGLVIALQLLFGLDLAGAVGLGALAVVGLVVLGARRGRLLEKLIFLMLGVIALAYVAELWMARPGAEVVRGLVPGGLDAEALAVARAILGAVVMPHNLFLHSGLVQSRRRAGVQHRQLLRRATVESAVALNLALLVNAAILVMAAAAFFGTGEEVRSLDQAHRTLQPLLGPAAAVLFAIALLAAGLASSVTGGMASQLVLDGLVRLPRQPPLVARRLVALVPATVVLGLGVSEIGALLLTQVVLSLCLPFVVVPLVQLCRDPELMGDLVVGGRLLHVGWLIASVLVVLNGAGLAVLVS